jgi:hypothetical protein
MTIYQYCTKSFHASERDMRMLGQMCAIVSAYIRAIRKSVTENNVSVRDYPIGIIEACAPIIKRFQPIAATKKIVVVRRTKVPPSGA